MRQVRDQVRPCSEEGRAYRLACWVVEKAILLDLLVGEMACLLEENLLCRESEVGRAILLAVGKAFRLVEEMGTGACLGLLGLGGRLVHRKVVVACLTQMLVCRRSSR